MQMCIHSHFHRLSSSQSEQILCLDETITREVERLEITEGVVHLINQHTSSGLFINENESRLLEDILDRFRRLLPPQGRYRHNDIWLRDCVAEEPENAHAHIIAILSGQTLTVPIHEGKLALGKWQSILYLELDGPRERKLFAQYVKYQ